MGDEKFNKALQSSQERAQAEHDRHEYRCSRCGRLVDTDYDLTEVNGEFLCIWCAEKEEK